MSTEQLVLAGQRRRAAATRTTSKARLMAWLADAQTAQVPGVLALAPFPLWGDKEFVLAAVAKHGAALEFASASLRADQEVVLAAVAQRGDALEHAAPELWSDAAVMRAAASRASRNGFVSMLPVMADAPPLLRGDRDVVLAAVTQSGRGLEFASSALKADQGVVLAAVAQDGAALEFAADALKADEAVVRAAVAQDSRALRYASAELRARILAACKEQTLAEIESAADEDVWTILMRAPEGLRADRQVVIAAVEKDGSALQHASLELRADRVVVLAATAADGYSLTFAAGEAKVEILKEAQRMRDADLGEAQVLDTTLENQLRQRAARALLTGLGVAPPAEKDPQSEPWVPMYMPTAPASKQPQDAAKEMAEVMTEKAELKQESVAERRMRQQEAVQARLAETDRQRAERMRRASDAQAERARRARRQLERLAELQSGAGLRARPATPVADHHVGRLSARSSPSPTSRPRRRPATATGSDGGFLARQSAREEGRAARLEARRKEIERDRGARPRRRSAGAGVGDGFLARQQAREDGRAARLEMRRKEIERDRMGQRL